MTKFRILLAATLVLGSLSAEQAFAQSYSMPGNDYVRQHPYADPALWRWCQTNYRNPKCLAVYPRPGSPRFGRH